MERLRPAAAGEKVVVRGLRRAGELRRGWGRAVRRWFVAAAAVVLLLSVVVLGFQSQGSLAQAASTCSSIQRQVNYVDESRRPLAHFHVTHQRWCWDGRAVTYVSPAKVVGKVTKLGAARGWRYDGLIGKNDYYFVHEGLSRGGHASIRKGAFAVCAKNTQCYQRTPRVQIYVYHDGRASSLARQ